jgi:hypothetical protein
VALKSTNFPVGEAFELLPHERVIGSSLDTAYSRRDVPLPSLPQTSRTTAPCACWSLCRRRPGEFRALCWRHPGVINASGFETIFADCYIRQRAWIPATQSLNPKIWGMYNITFLVGCSAESQPVHTFNRITMLDFSGKQWFHPMRLRPGFW